MTLAATPPMGWNSWNMFGKEIHEDLVKEMADAMVREGLRDAGYEYLVIDDFWHGGRGTDGELFADPSKFPSGIAALSDYVHARGLKFGIYSDAGSHTCGGCPGSMGHEEQDARTFAAWGVDFLKYDWCHAPDDRAGAIWLYTKMGRALEATGRPILFSICEWGHHQPWTWGREAGGHMWRTTADIGDFWGDRSHPFLDSIDAIGFEGERGLAPFAGPDRWNDLDMLVVGLYGDTHIGAGRGGCTDIEYRTHMSLWCIQASPLMVACDVRAMNDPTREILLNREIIAVDQDALGVQGARAARCGRGEVWTKPLEGGELCVGLFNRGDQPQEIYAHWSDLGIEGRYNVRDLWAHQDLGVHHERLSFRVEPHDCVMLRLVSQG